jgi:hypothetical protein
LPLVQYESEVLSECGAWKNFEELENALSLDELMILYESSIDRQNRLIESMVKVMGGVMGVDTGTSGSREDVPDYFNSDNLNKVKKIENAQDAARLPFGVGYVQKERD